MFYYNHDMIADLNSVIGVVWTNNKDAAIATLKTAMDAALTGAGVDWYT